MFADLGDKLGAVFRKLRSSARITESNVKSAVKEVRMALLEADVNYKVAKDFVGRVESRALGAEVLESITPYQQFIKIVHDELSETLGGLNYSPKINLSPQPPTVILMSGLQGSGKTTSCGKLARYFMRSGKSVLLTACDIYRPAAVEQLKTIGKSIGSDVYSDERSSDAVKIAVDSIAYARKAAKEVVIIDTAGRLHIDESLMNEISMIKSETNPHEVLYVADAMTGQDAVNSASEFNRYLDISGIILTKTDGDARGGAALSIKEVTGKPLLFVGTGEKFDDFELFHPERMAGRILGKGDIVSLVEKAQEAYSVEDVSSMVDKVKKQNFNFNDLLKQFDAIDRMGSLGSILKLIPGLGNALKGVDLDDGRMVKVKSMIYSMTPKEREFPGIINAGRKKRIARGSGRSVQDVNRLLEQLSNMNKMMKKVSKMAGSGKDPRSMLKNIIK